MKHNFISLQLSRNCRLLRKLSVYSYTVLDLYGINEENNKSHSVKLASQSQAASRSYLWTKNEAKTGQA